MEISSLKSSLCIPSSANSYGIAIEYMRNWFLSKFDKDYWKSVYIDGKFILDDFRQFNKHDVVKKGKPTLAIIPQVTFDYDRERLDMYQGTLHQLIRRSRADSYFFKDDDRNMYVSLMMEQLQMNFTFRMKVSSRAQQMELYKYIQMAFRIGSTQGEYIDIDFHIPYSLILQLAKDAGFEVIDNKIKNITKFVRYLNQHSILPVLYKYRNMNGKNEFFLRMSNMYTHISCTDYPNADDGEREGMIYSNFIIDMNVVLKIPMPKAYAYYSVEEHDLIRHIDNVTSGTFGITGIELVDAPDKNANGWEKLITTDYYEEDLTKPLTIDFGELFDDTDILRIIKYNNSMFISSSIFIDFLIYNNQKKIDYTIDWENLILNTDTIVDKETTSIVIYVDLNYINDTLINIDELNKSRL